VANAKPAMTRDEETMLYKHKQEVYVHLQIK